MFHGVRVVRGPDWKWGDQDGGHGCVGTVVPAQAKSESGVWVRWDSGKAANYRAGGASGKFDLRIYDNAQLGVKHPSVVCDGCQQDGVLGIRWKCLDCFNFDLCHACYNEGKHDLSHCFTRIEANAVPGVKVPCRRSANRCRSLGIFPGARVVRGPDWQWADQDGGDGTVGTVYEMDSGQGTYRSWVKVQWPNQSRNSYRVGHEGKTDLRYTERETMGEFYIDHLPRLDATKVRPYVNAGDKVRLLELDLAKLKELQLQRCGWNDEIPDFRGKVGEVLVVDKDGDIKVDFGGSSYFIHPLCLAKEKSSSPEEAVKAAGAELGELLADLVIKRQLEKVQELLTDSEVPGGDNSLFSAAANGNTNKVRDIIKNHPNAVNFQNNEGQTPLQAAAYRGHMDVVIALVDGKAPLEERDEDGDTALAFAVIGKEPDIVKYLLLVGSNINSRNKKGLTPLHLAVAKGHETCAEVIIKHEQKSCDVNCKDNDGDTPLNLAIAKDKKYIIQMLAEHPRIDVRLKNNKGFNSLHYAAIQGSNFAVEKILRAAPSMINIQKNDGFTALHIAALNGHTDIVTTLVKQSNCSKDLKNVNKQTPLHLAVDKGHNKCIEALVNNGANVNVQDKDGDTALHLVMIQASMHDILRSSSVGKLLELIQQLGNEGETSDPKTNLVAIAVYLINNGANIYIKNNDGQNVLDVTVNPGVEMLLKEHFEKRRASRTAAASSCKVS